MRRITPAGISGMRREGRLYLPDGWDREESPEPDSDLIFCHDGQTPIRVRFKPPPEKEREKARRGIPRNAPTTR